MASVRYGWVVSAGLILTAIPAKAQEAQSLPALPQADPAVQISSPLPTAPELPVAPIARGACTCKGKHGLRRWYWHRTQCKAQLQEAFLGYPEEFNEWPLGQALYAHGRTQVANGLASRMVFYEYDFETNSTRLNLKGQDKLKEIAAQLPMNFLPIIIERTPRTPGLDQGRQVAVAEELARGPFPVPPQRVVVGRPIATGLSGPEAVIVHANQLGQTASGGGIGGSPVGGAGLDGSALSGSAIATPLR